ncbi:AraC family transcriptional regulator [uncultured Chitinophaga sp.]|jgi:AraC-type DNA-binding domain-containing proteins|uniref:AraC family transcriptional regulator n=1 Tax=uncultured Chitinophaga sp. TaxID=339340 RepID=UPI00261A1C56|nr:AraC family transcriptional regulator [uncultured Chitinophaga sp.]
MRSKSKINVYDPTSFLPRFMPSDELMGLMKAGYEKFLVVKLEEMYRHVTKAVPASRSLTHSCLYLTSGEANMKIGSESYTIHKDQMLFVPAGQVFSFGENDVNKGYLCSFHEDILTGKFGGSELLKDFEFLQVWGNPRIVLPQQTSRFILHLFRRILHEYTQNGLNTPNIIQPYFIALLCEANTAYQPVSASTQTMAVNLTNRFKALLFANIRQHHLVSDYAALLNISPNHLNKTVKMITGKSPGKWIDETIVLEAKVLLSQTRFSISEIAAEVGIDDQSYFTRLFKKYEGLTPSEFRARIEKS